MGVVQHIYRVNNCVGFLALLLNTLLLWLILKRSPKELRTYSIILVQTCVLDMLFALALVLTMPVDQPLAGDVPSRLASLDAAAGELLPGGDNTTFLIFSFSALGAQFLYRYLVSSTALISPPPVHLMLVVPLTLAVMTATLQYTGAYAPSALANETAALLGPILEIEPGDKLVLPSIGTTTPYTDAHRRNHRHLHWHLHAYYLVQLQCKGY